MFNNFIGGGQVFLHTIRMFLQVFNRTIHIAILLGIIGATSIHYTELKQLDLQAFYSYRKAVIADDFDEAINKLRTSIRKKPNHITLVNVKTKAGFIASNIDPRKIKYSFIFKRANNAVIQLGQTILIWSSMITLVVFCAIFLLWSKFGKNLKAETIKDGSNKVLTSKEVKKQLRKLGKASNLTIGDMPLVKDMETRHFLVTGSTGSGKTNLFNTLLPQVRIAKQSALVIDQTGEMIARYYTPERGDIIFNPLDSRSHAWDFWTDATNNTIADIGIDTRLEKFAKILFSFGKKANSSGDPFWQNSAEIIFVSCVESLIRDNNRSFSALKHMLSHMPADSLGKKVMGTKGARYFSKNNKTTAESILSVMTTGARPLNLLFDQEPKFSLREYFQQVNNGRDAWLFLSTAPSQREVTLPLLACLLELAISYLIEIGINEKRRMWFIIDELSALGRLDAFTTLLSEARKYGGCVLAATQSVNQLFDNFGHYSGSTIFDQFATKFMFRSSEPSTAKMISEIFGQVEYAAQQKNTSYGANEYRDGISYTEQEKCKSLTTTSPLRAYLVSLKNFKLFQ